MRIKLFEEFSNENGEFSNKSKSILNTDVDQKGPEVLNSFADAEKLSKEDGIVILGADGDITDVEELIKDIPHDKAYILITDQSSPAPSGWKSDVFLVGGKKDGEISIQEYFKNNN